jgi:NADH:ubiquinone oxidoreductase subunit F (NADH-binding)
MYNAIQTLLKSLAFSSDKPENKNVFKVGVVKDTDTNALLVGTANQGWSASVIFVDAEIDDSAVVIRDSRLEVLIFEESAAGVAFMLRMNEFPDSVDCKTIPFRPGWAWDVHNLIEKVCAGHGKSRDINVTSYT